MLSRIRQLHYFTILVAQVALLFIVAVMIARLVGMHISQGDLHRHRGEGDRPLPISRRGDERHRPGTPDLSA